MPRPRSRLTGRGFGVLALGVALCAGGWFVREPALLWPGLFLALLPLGSLVAVTLGDPGLTVGRRLQPAEVEADDPVEVEVTLLQRRPTVAAALVVEERPPSALGGARTFLLPAPGRGRTTRESYSVRPGRRGRYAIDDLRYRYADPLGLAVREARPRGPAELVVLPRVLPLSGAEPAASGRTGETALPHLALSGPDDVLVREYRPRDDVRRIHWPSTARTGTLMVRREEQAWDPTAWVVLDTRRGAFAGGDAGADQFEWWVTLAASIGATLLDAGYQVSLSEARGVTYTFHPQERGAPVRDWQRHLVDVNLGGERSLAAAVRTIGQGPADHLVVALLGRLTLEDARELAQLRDGELRCWAFSLPAAPGEAEAEASAIDLLEQHGWRHSHLEVGVDPETRWRAVAAPAGRRIG